MSRYEKERRRILEPTCMLACKTVEREVMRAMSNARVSHPVIWVESGLHNNPKKLRERIQEELDSISQNGIQDETGTILRPKRVLMAFGTCGNALAGCRAGDFDLIVPRVDDCISLMMGSLRNRQEAARKHQAYYLTRGWMDGENNVIQNYARTLEVYGEELGDEIYRSLLGHYKNLALIDTGTYHVEQLKRETEDFCKTFGWGQVVLAGDLGYFEELINGPWDETRYIIKHPYETFTDEDMFLPS